MFFFIFGVGPHLQEQGQGALRTCPRCHNQTRWLRVRQVQRFSLFFIPIVSWGGRDFEQCGICGETHVG